MRLQLAIDTLTLSEAEALVSRVRDLVDLVEVGTPLVIREGVGAVRRLRALFPPPSTPTSSWSAPRSPAPPTRAPPRRRCDGPSARSGHERE